MKRILSYRVVSGINESIQEGTDSMKINIRSLINRIVPEFEIVTDCKDRFSVYG